MSKKLVVVFIVWLALAHSNLRAQITISGNLVDQNNKPADVTVLFHPKGEPNRLLSYTFSNKQGQFSKQLELNFDSICLRTRSLEFKDTTLLLANKTQHLEFCLPTKITRIKEVVKKGYPILNNRKDTLTYIVSAFTSGDDQSIGDVIKKMPGFYTDPDGKIYYQGLPIQKYYINGMDLLEQRYTLANENLPHGTVKSVEVLQHHQPIKMLRGKQESIRTSLNIKMKNDVTLTGRAELLTGLDSLQGLANITPILIQKKGQSLGSIQSNNIGKDLNKQHSPLTFSGGGLEGMNQRKEENVSIGFGTNLPIKTDRLLHNKAFLFTLNHLVKTKKEREVRFISSYFTDRVVANEHASERYVLEQDTLVVDEKKNLLNKRQSLLNTVDITNNSSKEYAKHELYFNLFLDSDSSNNFNTSLQQQKAETPHYTIGHKLNTIRENGNRFINFSSSIDYNNSDQSLRFYPAVFTELNGGTAQNCKQNFRTQGVVGEQELGVNRRFGKWLLSTNIGVNYEWNQVNTEVFYDTRLVETDSLRNNYNLFSITPYLEPSLRWKTETMSWHLNAPLRSIWYNKKDNVQDNSCNDSFVAYSPSTYFRYQFSAGIEWSVKASYQHKLGSFDQLRTGYTINNYRSLSKKSGILEEKDRVTVGSRLGLKSIHSGVFGHIQFTGSQTESNLFYQYKVLATGVTQTTVVEKKNQSDNYYLGGEISKYFTNYSTTISFKGNSQWNSGDRLYNGFVQNSKVQQTTLAPHILINLSKTINLNYGYEWKEYNQEVEESSFTAQNQKHDFSCSWFYKKHAIGLIGEHYISSGNETNSYSASFFDASYTIRPKKKLMFRLKCRNILNSDVFKLVSVSDLYQSFQSVQIRPREFHLSASFTF